MIKKLKESKEEVFPAFRIAKKLEEKERIPYYQEAQMIFELKEQTISRVTDFMKRKFQDMQTKVLERRTKLTNMAQYSKSGNLKIRRHLAKEDELALTIYNPNLYNKRTDVDEFELPVADIEETIEKKVNKQQMYLQVDVNMKTIHRYCIATSDIITWSQENSKLTKKILTLGEIRIFNKLKQIYGTEKDIISLFNMEHLINFKIRLTDEPLQKSRLDSNEALATLSVDSSR